MVRHRLTGDSGATGSRRGEARTPTRPPMIGGLPGLAAATARAAGAALSRLVSSQIYLDVRGGLLSTFTHRNPADGANLIYAELHSGGILEAAVEAVGANRIRGSELFSMAVESFGRDNIHGVRGLWSYGGNLATVNRLTGEGAELGAAALETFTGKMATRMGFESVEVMVNEGVAGAYTRVEVLFR